MDNFKIYCKDIDKYPLLTKEEEVDLSDIINNSEDKSLVEKSVDKLVVSNLRLVIMCALEFNRFLKGNGYTDSSLMDIVAEGNIGLMRVCRVYESEKGKFSTYAVPAIKRQIVRRYWQKSGMIYVPLGHKKHLMKIRDLREKYGTPDLPDDLIMEEIGISKYLLSKLKDSEKVFVRSFEDFGSVDDDGTYSSLLDFYVDPDEKIVSDVAIEVEEKEYLLTLINKLNDKEQDVVLHHFYEGGYISDPILIKKHNVTKQMMNMLYHTAMEKLNKMIKADVASGKIHVPNYVIRRIEEQRKKIRECQTTKGKYRASYRKRGSKRTHII